MRGIDNVYPFVTAENGVVSLNPRTDCKGYLELQAIEGGAAYLFRGKMSAAECEQALKGERPAFIIAAAIGQSATASMEGGIGQVTVFSKKATTGFLRTVEYVPDCDCHK